MINISRPHYWGRPKTVAICKLITRPTTDRMSRQVGMGIAYTRTAHPCAQYNTDKCSLSLLLYPPRVCSLYTVFTQIIFSEQTPCYIIIIYIETIVSNYTLKLKG